MSKMYVKDKEGKYKLVDKPEPQVIVNQEPAPLTLENVNERLLKIEELLETMMKK